MADTIKCPVCGEVNPADLEFCQNCQSRLQPLTGPLKGEDAPLRPGQVPTKKVTSELEPILPQWLRNARQQARQSAAEEAAQEPKTTPASRGQDLLAGLTSQGGDEDEETPDWLSNITGVPSKKKKSESEDAHTKWVELGHDEPAPPASNQTRGAEADFVPPRTAPQETAPARDELADWFKQAVAADEGAAAPVQPATPEPEPLQPSDEGGVGWFQNLETSASAFQQEPEQPRSASRSDTADWLKNLDNAPAAFDQAPPPQSAPPSADAPDWLKNLDQGGPAFESQAANQIPALENQAPPSSQANVPDWLKSFGETSAAPEVPAAAETPDWLKTAAASSEAAPAAKPSAPAADSDWIASLKPPEPDLPSTPAFTGQELPPETGSTAAAFTEGSVSSGDVDEIFASMQMPDWLSDVAPTNQESLPPAAGQDEAIAPAELPSWVQAMRPVESALPDSSVRPADTTLETLGPLAGLHGVLPAVPGAVGASSKPKSHSIKINASEEQQSHAVLLEQILAAETAPVPMKAGSVLTTQRTLRWAITGLLGFVLSGALFAGTQLFPLPLQAPNETNAAMDVTESLPEGAPVLVVFDYEPSTVGEMEATSASLMHHLLLLKHPRLALVSTSPTGPALAERFMTITLADRGYQPGAQYVDLGYLPGGLAGIHNFALDPVSTIPLGMDATPVWQSPLMQGVTHLSDFAAIIILTDSAEGGRFWIEQAGLARGSASLLILSSAQAGPMLMPYVDSGQVNGLIAGINGGAGAEERNTGLPGFVRRYWDAYSIGLLLAVAVMVLGGLWNLVLGLQNRSAQEAK